MSEQVTSLISDLTCRNGKTVMSSGRRPSPQSSHTGSSTECIPAALIMSFRDELRGLCRHYIGKTKGEDHPRRSWNRSCIDVVGKFRGQV